MKIQKIRLRNINSLRGECTISFCVPPLSEARLFAITGATGAGKSTILDAITLALFNRIPRLGSLSKNTIEKAGSILTQYENECLVEVEYTCKAGHYRSTWSIRKTRTGNLDNYKMELVDLQTNTILDIKVGKVPDKNEALIGLTYEQFIKSVLLSQGEFSKFLQSSKDERGKLLEDITGMQIYRELGKRAYEKFKEKNESITTSIELIEAEKLQLLTEEHETALNHSIKALTLGIEAKEKERNDIIKLLHIKNAIFEIDREIQQYEKDKIEVNKQLEDFTILHLEKMQKHKLLISHLKKIRDYSANQESINKIGKNISVEEHNLVDIKKDLDKTLLSIHRLINIIVNEEDAIAHLNIYRKKIIELKTNKESAESAFNTQKNRIVEKIKQPDLNKYYHLFSEEKFQDLVELIRQDITLENENIQSYLHNLNIGKEVIDTKIDELHNRKSLLIELKGLVGNFAALNNKLSENKNQIENISKQLDTDNAQLIDFNQQKQQITPKILAVAAEREQHLVIQSQKLEEQRKKLVDGEPCPLCGSTSHPYAQAHFAPISDLTIILNDLKKQDEHIEKKIYELTKVISQNNGQMTFLQKEKEKIEKDVGDGRNKIDLLKEKLQIEKIGNEQIVEKWVEETEKHISQISHIKNKIYTKDNLNDLEKELTNLVSKFDDVNNKNLQYASAYRGKDINKDCDIIIDLFQKSKQQIAIIKKTLDTNHQELSALQGKQRDIISTTEKAVVALGYQDISSCLPDIMEDITYQEVYEKWNNINKDIDKVNSLYNSAIERKEKEMQKDDALQNKEQLDEKIKLIDLQLKELKQQYSEAFSNNQENKNRKKRIETLHREVQEKRNINLKWELLSKYIGDATGKNFSTFAQRLTLKRLIIFANMRLKKFSDRYLLDMPKQSTEDELMVIDAYLGDQRRSVKTLSGGETFIVSLAMALGLSDLASGNIKLESLFIDEGFGSLDPETLDTAISILELLQTESNKTIGIISHVDSLKERIDTQIQLEKGNNGFSRIEIKRL